MSEIQNGTEKKTFGGRTYTVNEIARILGVSRTQTSPVQEDPLKSQLVTPYEFPSGRLTSGWSRLICDIRKEGRYGIHHQRKKKLFVVVYSYVDENGETKQKWETRSSYQDALKRKAEIESQKSSHSFLPPTNQNIAEFLSDFVSLYGEKRWACPCMTAKTR